MADRLRKSLKKGLIDIEKCLPGGSLKATLASLSGGGLTESPFPEKEVEKIRDNLRKILVHEGFEDGLPKEGDRIQATEARLLQELLRAFEDPDHYFCEWWSRGIWLGSPERPLPRAPALYQRKTKWPLKDDSTQLDGDWRTNYSSVRDHEAQVEKQYDDEVK